MQITHRVWVPLVGDEELERLKAAARKTYGSLVKQRLWRQIEACANSQGIKLKLMNVDEEAARGGYWSGGEACREVELSWEHIEQAELIQEMFRHEQVCVLAAVSQVLGHFRNHSVAVREVLEL